MHKIITTKPKIATAASANKYRNSFVLLGFLGWLYNFIKSITFSYMQLIQILTVVLKPISTIVGIPSIISIAESCGLPIVIDFLAY